MNWSGPLKYSEGRWRGAIEAPLTLEVHCTHYSKPWDAPRPRKGTPPPQKTEVQLGRRTAGALGTLPKLVPVIARELARLWNTQWRNGRKAITTATIRKQLVPTLLLFNAGEHHREYMLWFSPVKSFGEYLPHVSVEGTRPRLISLESPRDAKHQPTLPHLPLERCCIELP